MLGSLKNIFGFGPKTDYAALMQQGAQIIDVRSPGEFAGGHIPGSVNIPLDTLSRQLTKIRKDKPVITCCASGMRSAAAKQLLSSNGYQEVYNGGGWNSLMHQLV
jgi:phage shock protein E